MCHFNSGLKQDVVSSLIAFNCDLYSAYQTGLIRALLPPPTAPKTLSVMEIIHFIPTLIYVFECICITFIYTIVLVFNIIFWYNKLFTYTISNTPLTIGAIFSVFLGYDEQVQDLDIRLECGK